MDTLREHASKKDFGTGRRSYPNTRLTVPAETVLADWSNDMNRHSYLRVLFFCLLCLSAVSAEADTPAPEKRRNAINFRIPDAFLGSYFLNFEHLFGSRHGLVLEGGYIGSYNSAWNFIGSYKAKWQVSQGYTLSAQYRFHFSDKLDSPFLGVFFKYGSVAGKILYAGGSGVAFDSESGQPQIGFSTLYQIIGVNIGHRFIFEPGITITMRLGFGSNLGTYKYSTADFPQNTDAFRSTFNMILGFDAEISAGYAF